MFPLPEIGGKRGLVRVDYRFDSIVHRPEGLVGPEIAAGIGEGVILEEEFITEIAGKHEIGLYLLVFEFEGRVCFGNMCGVECDY